MKTLAGEKGEKMIGNAKTAASTKARNLENKALSRTNDDVRRNYYDTKTAVSLIIHHHLRFLLCILHIIIIHKT